MPGIVKVLRATAALCAALSAASLALGLAALDPAAGGPFFLGFAEAVRFVAAGIVAYALGEVVDHLAALRAHFAPRPDPAGAPQTRSASAMPAPAAPPTRAAPSSPAGDPAS